MEYRHVRSMLTAAYAGTGAVVLSFEVLWFRSLELTLGSSAQAAAALLAGYMAGLSLGAFTAGSVLGRGGFRPGRTMAVLHLFIALTGLLTLWFGPLESLMALPRPWSLLAAFLVVVPAAAAAGSTLPAAALFISPGVRRGRTLAALYGYHIIGGLVGVSSVALIGIEFMGSSACAILTVMIACVLSPAYLALGFAYEKAQNQGASITRPDPDPMHDPEPSPAAIIAAFAIGAAGLGTEIALFRQLTPVMGLSVYALAGTLLPFLGGLGLGGLLAARITERSYTVLPGIMSCAAAGCFGLVLWVIPILPGSVVWIAGLSSSPPGWFHLLLARILTASVFVLPAAVMAGTLFPLLLAGSGGQDGPGPRTAGLLAGANTLGAVLGPVLVNFSLVSLVGTTWTYRLMAALYLLIALYFFLLGRAIRPAWLVIPALVVIAAAPSPELLNLHSGPYWAARMYAHQVNSPFTRLAEPERSSKEIKASLDGPNASVLVVQEGRQRYLVIDGKPASNTFLDRPTQLALAAIPLSLHPEARDVLVIGWGSGQTVAEVLEYPVRSVVCVEISREVAEAAPWFREVNAEALMDPRLSFVVDDARHYLRSTKRRFDLIISQPSNPWVGFSGSLFTREFLVLCRDTLTPGGSMAQWFQYYGSTWDDLDIFLRTFSEAFRNWGIWSPSKGDLVILGNTITEKNLGSSLDGALVPPSATSSFVVLPPGSSNTDDRPVLSYSMARHILMPDPLDLADYLGSRRAN